MSNIDSLPDCVRFAVDGRQITRQEALAIEKSNTAIFEQSIRTGDYGVLAGARFVTVLRPPAFADGVWAMENTL